MYATYNSDSKPGSTFGLGMPYHRIPKLARGTLQEEAQSQRAQDSANGDAGRSGAVEQRGS